MRIFVDRPILAAYLAGAGLLCMSLGLASLPLDGRFVEAAWAALLVAWTTTAANALLRRGLVGVAALSPAMMGAAVAGLIFAYQLGCSYRSACF